MGPPRASQGCAPVLAAAVPPQACVPYARRRLRGHALRGGSCRGGAEVGAGLCPRRAQVYHSEPPAQVRAHVLEADEGRRASALQGVPAWLLPRVRDGGLQPPREEAPRRLLRSSPPPKGEGLGAARGGAGRLRCPAGGPAEPTGRAPDPGRRATWGGSPPART